LWRYRRYANATNVLSQHARFPFETGETVKIVSDVKEQIGATCYETVRAGGVSKKDTETIRGAFVFSGFSLSAPL
jgi:serine/threonine-protein kinase HipA